MRTGIHTARPVIPQEFLQAKHKRPRPCIVIRQKTGNAPFSVFFRRIGSPTLKSGEKRTTFKSPEMPNDVAQQDANLPFLSPAPVPERQQPQKRAVLPGLPQPALVPQHASGRRPPPHAAALPFLTKLHRWIWRDRPRTQRHSVQRPPPKTLRIPPKPALPARVPTPRAHCSPSKTPPEGPGTSRRKPRTRRWFRRFSRRPPPELRKAPAGTELPHLPAKAPSLSSTGSPADLRTTKSAPPPNGNTPRTQEGHKMKASRKQEGTTGPVSLAAPSLLAFICRLSA